jgi:uncharacterized phosphosugar-binding protein
MKRRDIFGLIPFIAGAGCISNTASAREMQFQKFIEPGEPLGMVYLRKVRERLQWVRETQSGKILEAAYAIARTVEKGGRCWCLWDLGHTNESDIFPNRNGEPEIFIPGYNPKQVKDGDLVLLSLGTAEYLPDIAKKDLFVIGTTCPWSGDVPDLENVTPEIRKVRNRDYSDIWIETNTDSLGAVVNIPGSPGPFGPESGPLNGTIFWMMVADACRVLSRDRKPVKVKGDEPKLTGNAPMASVYEPLMDEYFDTVMRQLEMIAMEMGDIRKMAEMTVDTLLGGGNVYFYSRYSPSLSNEATGRRGGFLFARGLADGNIQGTSKDCVIMGTSKPDDEADLTNLGKIKGLGMKVFSIGPITRDFKIPEGRIVARETAVHVGRITDTYGLFSLPGFEQKVCPTSGIINTAILWTMSSEIVQQIIKRTGGNVPSIYLNGVLKWGNSFFNPILKAMNDSRGY